MRHIPILLLILASLNLRAQPITIVPSDRVQRLTAAPLKVGGKVQEQNRDGLRSYRFQWPAIYFECAFVGTEACFDVGSGRVIYHVIVDGVLQPPLTKPKPGRYRILGLAQGEHLVRVEVVTESSAPNQFGGFFIGPHTRPSRLHERRRQIDASAIPIWPGMAIRPRPASVRVSRFGREPIRRARFLFWWQNITTLIIK